MFNIIRRLFTRTRKPIPPCSGHDVPGYLVFQHTSEVIKAEELLTGAGFAVAVQGPPPDMRTGCDMILVIDMMQATAIRHLLDTNDLPPLQLVPASGSSLKPVSLWHTRDYGRWLMVRAANMKITLDKGNGIIVNISGGGCPDVPYLAAMLTGKSINGPVEPRQYGRTLCAYALQLAFEEARRQWHG